MKRTLLILFAFTTYLSAQNDPFNCDYNAYLFQHNDVFAIDLASGNSYEVATDVTPGKINAAAYNPADGYIWGSLSTPEKTIVRIGKDFQTTTYYIDELSSAGRYIGDISADGMYYLKGGGTTYYAIDLDPNSTNFGNHYQTLTFSQNLSIHDWAFNAVDGLLYTVEKGTNILYRINPETSSIENLGEVPILSGLNYTYGAVYFDASGRFYVSANQTGTVYVIQNVQTLTNTSTIDSNIFAFGPSSSSNDGARCPTAPVPQEDCINGVDDDGDGLVDCEDPSCSGVAACPIIEAPTSSGNSGGLESNNRLSEKINRRNFNRVKNSYKFDNNSAKKVIKPSKYGKKTSKKSGSFELSDLVPFDIVNEESVVESSPDDLVAITNATDIYSVDYLKNNEAVATVLLVQTEDGVYEHSKAICDRLLGAKIISVSTMEIREQQFIKTLLRNTDGVLEFALSFSAKPIDGDTNFEIESHWNINVYENNAAFYNFQIWSNSLDDLYNLAEETLNLLEAQKPITNYVTSKPPTVFVRKGEYVNGKLNLEIVNTNRTGTVTFDAGVRSSETGSTQNVTSNIDLEGNYISNVEVDAGTLFDVGFRIGDGVQIPDDLFLSDGSWGYDDAATSTSIVNYTVDSNTASFADNQYVVERNVTLEATTSEYVAVYRSLTPRFNAVDLTEYEDFNIKAKGTGTLHVRLIKESINVWEEQYKVSIPLTNTLTTFKLPLDSFTSTTGQPFVANDIVTIVFTMEAENGEMQTKEMDLQEINFSFQSSLSIDDEEIDGVEATALPNPMSNRTMIQFASKISEDVSLDLYNQDGRLVKQINYSTRNGNNEVLLERNNLSSGLYICKINSKTTTYKAIKLVVE